MSILQGPVDTDPQDPWVTHHSGYDQGKIYTRATDGHGHSEILHAKLSPSLMAVVREACQKVPEYRTYADVVRDALIHRMHEISTWPEDHVNLQPIDTEVRQAEIDLITDRREQWTRLIGDLDRTLGNLIDEGDYETAEQLITENAAVDSMTPPFQIKLGSVIQKHLRSMNRERPVLTLND